MSDFIPKLLIVSAPSGAGKTTITREIMRLFKAFEFSISATTRAPRSYEKEGVHYYFLTQDIFFEMRSKEQFIEWEEVYPGKFYGTLKSEVDRILQSGKCPIFDVDVEGGLNIKKQYQDDALAVFIQPPSLDTLEERLKKRSADSDADIQIRLDKAHKEMQYASRFDYVIVNDVLEKAIDEFSRIIEDELAIKTSSQ